MLLSLFFLFKLLLLLVRAVRTRRSDKCPGGKYQPSVGQQDCISCVAGKASNSDATDCEQCLSGTFVKDNVCNDCPAGRYAPTAATDECASCNVGFYTDTVTKATTW